MSTPAASLQDMENKDMLREVLWDYRVARSLWLASLVLVTYDAVLTISNEVDLFHKKRRTYMAWLFLVNRYWPIIGLLLMNIDLAWPNPTTRVCSFWFQWLGYSALPIQFSAGAILVVRLYALYDRSKIISRTLMVLLFAQVTASATFIGIESRRFTKLALPGGYTGCMPVSVDHNMWIYWIPPICFEAIVAILSLHKVAETFCKNQHHSIMRLWKTMLRDSMVYICGIFIALSVNCLLVGLGQASRGTFWVFPGCVFPVHSILGCRMLINIRENAHNQEYSIISVPIVTQ